MTGKRFTYDDFDGVFYDGEQILTDEEILKLLNELNDEKERLEEENGQLREALKKTYINEICETCRYGNYFLTDNFDGGFEGDFECTKKHFGNEHWKCDGLTECNDFELNLKGDVE